MACKVFTAGRCSSNKVLGEVDQATVYSEWGCSVSNILASYDALRLTPFVSMPTRPSIMGYSS